MTAAQHVEAASLAAVIALGAALVVFAAGWTLGRRAAGRGGRDGAGVRELLAKLLAAVVVAFLLAFAGWDLAYDRAVSAGGFGYKGIRYVVSPANG